VLGGSLSGEFHFDAYILQGTSVLISEDIIITSQFTNVMGSVVVKGKQNQSEILAVI